jgi:hypothetical protein
MLGIWTEQYGGRIVFPLQMILAAIATWLLTWAETYPMFLVAALGVGSPAARSRSASPMSRAGIRRRSRARRSASSAPATSARRSPSSVRPS